MAPKKDAVDDDPVTAEYDVFITPELQEKLFLLQFPSRDREKPYNEDCNNKPLELRIKPRSGFVEVDIPTNAEVHYDKKKAKMWNSALAKSKSEGSTGQGMAAGFLHSTAGRARPQFPVDRSAPDNLSEDEEIDGLAYQTLGGQITQHTRGKPVYMVGAFRDAELHLTKLDGMVQMRPQFHYIDAKTQIERNKSRRDREVGESKPAEPRMVQQIAKSTHPGEFDVSDTKELLQAAHEEPWLHLSYRDEEEEEAYQRYHDKLFFENSRRAPKLTASMDNEAYLDNISAPRVDARGRARVKPQTKKQKMQIDIAESDGSDAERGAQ